MDSVEFVSNNGVRGRVIAGGSQRNSDTTTVVFETGRRAEVETRYLRTLPDGSAILDLNVDPRPPNQHERFEPSEDSSQTVIPRAEEQLVVGKRVTETGRVRVTKTVQSSPENVDELFTRTEYEIKRVPIDREVSEVQQTRVEGDVTIIPVHEEVRVVTKRLILREEIHLTRTQREEHRPRVVVLQKEQISIERTTPKSEGFPN